MSGVTIVWSMIAAACLTLAAVHFPVWWRNREARASLAFSLAGLSTAALAFCELRGLKATTLEVFVEAHRWSHVPIALILVSIAAFTYYYLGAGRLWLAFTALGLRAVALLLNFTTGESINHLKITEFRSIPFMGESVSVALGVANPWQAVGQLGVLALVLFVVDASVTAWRRGERAAALTAGISLVFLMLAGVTQAVLIYWGQVAWPGTISVFALGFILVMGYALSADLLRVKQLALDLSEREQETTLAADAANLGTWTRDIASDTVSASPRWRELFGYAPDERLHLEDLLRRVHPDDRADFQTRLARAISDRGEYHAEFRVILPSGQVRWLGSSGRVEIDARNHPLRIRGASIDITLRKQAEHEVLQLRQDMAHVGRVSVMGQLAATLAHEINQPLGAILRNAEAATLFLQAPTPDLTEIGAILDDIRKDDQHAGDVIDRMRSMLRRQEIVMTRLDVAQMLGDVANLSRPDAVARQISLEFAVPADLPPVKGDRVLIHQVLLNLIMNGMDALEGIDGPGRRVSVSARREAQSIEFCVMDTGCGIPPAQFERIFDPFFTTKAKGIGMGLSISRGIVQLHGGRLWAENDNLGGGAKFTFTLPIAT